MTAGATQSAPCSSDHCITCADEGVPMRVTQIDSTAGLARCRGQDGTSSTVETALVEPVGVGDHVLVHAGVALVALDRARAPT